MTDMISKNENGNVCFIITVENPMPHEKQIINGTIKVIDYNRQCGIVRDRRTLSVIEREVLTDEEKERLQSARNIIERYGQAKREVEGIKEQMIKDLKNGEDPYKIILYASSIISRLEGNGDNFLNEVETVIQSKGESI